MKIENTELWEKCKATPLCLTIPQHPPSVNKLYATFRGRRIKARCGHEWEAHAGRFVREAAREAYGTANLSKLKGRPMLFEAGICRQSWVAKSGSGLFVRPDLDGFLKALIDSFMTALELDDCAIIEIRARKIYSLSISTMCQLSFL